MKFIEDLDFIVKSAKPNSKISISSFINNICLNTGFQAIILYRISHFFYKSKLPFLHRFFNFLGRLVTGSDISYAAIIGGGFMICHGMGVVIGAKVVIGKKVKIMNDVTLGSKWSINNDGQPTIGDNVTIGVGARILGSVAIGDNAVIGANAVVIQDVPANCIAVGIPAKIINKGASTDE